MHNPEQPHLPEAEAFRLPEEKEREKEPRFDAAVVFGSYMAEKHITNPDGTKQEKWDLTIGGKLRALGAYELYKKGEVRELFLTGGHVKGPDAPSEAELMKEYIVRKAVADLKLHMRQYGNTPEEIEAAVTEEQEKLNRAIQLEEGATNTIENFAYTLNKLDSEPEKYKNIALLSNQFHLPRIHTIAKQFNLEAESIGAEKQVHERSPERYQKFLDKAVGTQNEEFMNQAAAENRWDRGMEETPEYWIMQAAYVDQPRLKEMIAVNRLLQGFIQERLGEQFEERYHKPVSDIDAMTDAEFSYLQNELKSLKRELPPEEWASLSVAQKYTARGK